MNTPHLYQAILIAIANGESLLFDGKYICDISALRIIADGQVSEYLSIKPTTSTIGSVEAPEKREPCWDTWP
jgi:hypothetical protein